MITPDRVKRNGMVDIWDLGPQVGSAPPQEPQEPDKSKLKGVALAAAEVEYEDAVEAYKAALRDYNHARAEKRIWDARMGGPLRHEMWAVNAREAMERDPKRYVLDLPKGMKPGKAQLEAEQREKVANEEIRQARARDPMHAGAAA